MREIKLQRNKIMRKNNVRENKIMDSNIIRGSITITRRNKIREKQCNNGKKYIIIKKKIVMRRITGRMEGIITRT